MDAIQPRIKYRSMPLQVLLCIVTLGIYALYWFYQTAVEMQDAVNDHSGSPALWILLMFIPFGAFFSYYWYSQLYEKYSDSKFNLWLLWVIWLVFSPAVWFIVQSELNRRSTWH